MCEYILKAKIIGCSDLTFNGQPATDKNPFVTLEIDGGDKIWKTQTLYGDANPQFNEEIEIPINDPTKESLKVVVRSEATPTDQDLCDPFLVELSALDINPLAVASLDGELHLRDAVVGTISLELNLAKAEESTEDVFTGPILLRCKVLQAEGVTSEVQQGADTFLSFRIQNQDESQAIKSIVNKVSADPAWNQKFSMIINNPATDIIVVNMTSGNINLIKDLEIPAIQFPPGMKCVQELTVSSTGEVETGGHVSLEFSSMNLNQSSEKPVQIHLRVIDAVGLTQDGPSQVIATVSDQENKTSVQTGTNPTWDESFDYESRSPLMDSLRVSLVNGDQKLINDVYLPVRDFDASPEPIYYDTPVRLGDQPAGHIRFEVTATGQSLTPKQASGAITLEATLVEQKYQEQEALVRMSLLNNAPQPRDALLNKTLNFEIPDPQTETLIITVVDPTTNDKICDPISLPLSQLGVNQSATFQSKLKRNDAEIGLITIDLLALGKDKISKKDMQHRSIPVDNEESQTIGESILDDNNGYCNFTWGDYGSTFSTSFTGYSHEQSLSSTISEAEIRWHRHDEIQREIQHERKPKRSDTFSGRIRSINFNNDALTPGDEYYVTAHLLGKSSRQSAKSDWIKSDPVVPSDKSKLEFKHFKFDYNQKVKKGDYLEVFVYHAKDQKKIASSVINLEKLESSDDEVSKTFDVNDASPVTLKTKAPAIGTMKTRVKHTVMYK